MLTELNKENRKNGIGASEAGTIMGLNKWMSPYELWRLKTGLDEPEDLSNKPAVHWGNVHEETIAQEYARVTGQKVRKLSNTIFHKEYKFMLCHIDRKIEGLPKVLECKFACFNSDDWGPSGSDIVPWSYMVQVQYQLAVTGYQEADLAVLISGFDFRIYHFKRDEQLIAKIEGEVKAFWELVITNTPPPLRNSSDVEIAYPIGKGFKQADEQVIENIAKMKTIKTNIKLFEAEQKEIKNKITLFLLNAEGVQSADQVLATWKADKNGSRTLRIMG